MTEIRLKTKECGIINAESFFKSKGSSCTVEVVITRGNLSGLTGNIVVCETFTIYAFFVEKKHK